MQALMALNLWKATVVLSVLLLHAIVITITAHDSDQYREERSQRGIGLLNSTYKSFYSANYPTCLLACKNESRCLSLNYWLHKSQCDLNNRTKYSAAPRSLICNHSVTYMEMMRESCITVSYSYRSCNEVHPSCGDGEYSIDPTSSGYPFTVYCDMTTDGGGWTLIHRTLLTNSTDASSFVAATHYRNLSKYKEYIQLVPTTVLLKLRQDMGFTQLRFYCHQKVVGTTLHIMTNNNASGEAVVRFFTDDAYRFVRPQSCGSYAVLPDDNSKISQACQKWGSDQDGKWGFNTEDDEIRLFKKTIKLPHENAQLRMKGSHLKCDVGNALPLSSGDKWDIYVR